MQMAKAPPPVSPQDAKQIWETLPHPSVRRPNWRDPCRPTTHRYRGRTGLSRAIRFLPNSTTPIRWPSAAIDPARYVAAQYVDLDAAVHQSEHDWRDWRLPRP